MPFYPGNKINPSGLSVEEHRRIKKMRQFCQLTFNKYGRNTLLKFINSHKAVEQQWALEMILQKGFPNIQINENYNVNENDFNPAMLEAELRASEERFAAILKKYHTTITGLPISGTGTDPASSTGIPQSPSA